MSTIFSAPKQLLQKRSSWSLCLLSFVRGSSPLPPTARSGQPRLHHFHNISWTWSLLELAWKCSGGLYCLVGNFVAINFINNIMMITDTIYSSISMVSIAMIIIVIYYHPYTVAPEPSSVGICSSYLMDPSVEGNLSEQIECFLSAMMWVGALRWSPFFGLFMVQWQCFHKGRCSKVAIAIK